jgi:hypothetical protein|tara:strand:+ start:228 stop:422 length:195 start_codon:yes stop_codon:yes gene_type:complete
MKKIEARKMLIDFTTGDYPQMKSEDRSRLHRSTYKMAYPEEMKKRAVSSSDLKGIVDIANIKGK